MSLNPPRRLRSTREKSGALSKNPRKMELATMRWGRACSRRRVKPSPRELVN